ncbi:MAG: ABC transporter ATP-binding protein [Nitrosomonas sp.]|nr:ABC transporter ATP-binding protein [Nitrosomonas sp.]
MSVVNQPAPNPILIQIDHLCKSYELTDRSGELISQPVLFDISLTINQGEFIAIMGHSGSGKSTLMNILGCLDTPTSGNYWLSGRNVATMNSNELAHVRNQNIGFVFQSFNLLKRMTALENIAIPLLYAGIGRKESLKRSQAMLDLIGLGKYRDHLPNQLSGGQQQRVAISRALINQPQLLLADEPTGNLDTQTSHDIMTLFTQLNRNQGITIVLITHEEDIAAHAQRLIRLKDGRIVQNEVKLSN